MYIGVSCLGHDGAVAVCSETQGTITYALSEERFSNEKNRWYFPLGVLSSFHFDSAKKIQIGVNVFPQEFLRVLTKSELNKTQRTSYCLLPNNPMDLFERIHMPFIPGTLAYDYFDDGFKNERQWHKEVRRQCWYRNWFTKYRQVVDSIKYLFPGIEIVELEHHLCHAASAFYPSAFQDATIVSWDGKGESQTTCIYRGDDSGIALKAEALWPASLGMVYLAVTKHLGYDFGDEFRVMGMAAYGEPVYKDLFLDALRIDPSGRLEVRETPNYRIHEFDDGHSWYNLTPEFSRKVPKRKKNGALKACHFHLAASVQAAFEEFGVAYVRKAMELCGSDRVCLTGGVALNGLMNEAIRKKSGCRDLYIFPASGDDGTAAGAALLLAAREGIRNPRKVPTAFFGPPRPQEEIETYLREAQVPFEKPADIHAKIADALAEGKVVARYLGSSEFGPRALGHRSILAHPGRAEMKDLLNRKIKHREPFRPFAPACLEESAPEFFDLDVPSPFMLLIPQARESVRKKIPAAVHHDGTARVQTVNALDNPEFYQTIQAFQQRTGLPVVLNTSFNINGEAIVETPQDAVESFAKMEVDYLAIGDCWLGRDSVQHLALPREDPAYLELRRERYRRDFPHFLRGWDLEPDPWRNCFPRVPRPSRFRRFLQKICGKT